ncbi:hypothetical protein BDN72DRAFT_756973 [Pluteus cervinus]|uniref:Uncharacterized protein n=1 Tax=Pluteus cervinus TaxID=181527 RepID=A0ACD3BDH2_9AGAR|nr:hypothetical protein BDN72DRAFT_756973 [Pluteus cervinus]
MRAPHTPHLLEAFPIYSSAFLSEHELILGGGGGATRSGIKNKLRLYNVKDDRSIELLHEHELEKGEDAPMSMAAFAGDNTVVCGINSVEELLKKGENQNCRVFSVNDKKLSLLGTHGTLPPGESDDFQKVTVISQDGQLVAVAGAHDLAILSYPSLAPVAQQVHTEKEIYDVVFTASTIVVVTTSSLLIYSLPSIVESSSQVSSKGKGKRKEITNLTELELLKSVDVPSVGGFQSGSTFRAARYHPQKTNVIYTVINTNPPRTSKKASRQGYVCRWNTESWTVEKSRKVSDRGLTCFDISADGKLLAFGSSDLNIGLLDSTTLAVSLIVFWPTSTCSPQISLL